MQIEFNKQFMKIVVNQMAEQEISDLKETFIDIDINETGTIRLSDLK